MPTLFTTGYGAWPTANRLPGLIAALHQVRVTTLVDIRHSPCSSNLIVGHQYGPKDWHLQAQAGGFPQHLQEAGIEYRWLVELGNPQKNDHEMRIFREHLESGLDAWPATRGLKLLSDLLQDRTAGICILCACKVFAECHRSLVAEAVSQRYFDGGLTVVDLTPNGPWSIK